jgi:ABC-type spermidine/putrescine transport system permease subunit II
MSVIDQLRRDVEPESRIGRLYHAIDIRHGLVSPILALLLFMFVGPMAFLVLFSIQSGNEVILNPATWTLSHYVEFVTGIVTGSGVYGQVLTTTTLISVSTVVLTLVISFPAAYGLARKVRRFKTAILVALILPLLTSVTMRVLGWVMFLMNNGVLSAVLDPIGVAAPSILYQETAIVLGTTYVYLPFMLFPIYLSMLSIPESLYTAASDLGASRRKVFTDIVLPLSKPGVVIGSLFVFVLSLGASVESELLGGGSAFTMATNIQYSFGIAQNFPLGSVQAVSLLLIAGGSGVYILRNLDLADIAERSGGTGGHTMTSNSGAETFVWYSYVLLVVLFLLVPIVAIIIASTHQARVFALPYEFTLDWYAQVVSNQTIRGAVISTLKIAIPVTIISTVIGTAAAIAYTRYTFARQELFKIFVLLPIFFPLILIGLGMSMWTSTIGFGYGILQTIVGEVVWISPIVMFVVSITALGIDPNIEEAARDLGADTKKLYADIVLPLIADGVISGAIFAFVLSWNNYYIASYMSGSNILVTTWIHSRLTQGFSALVPGVAAVLFYVSLFGVIAAFGVLRLLSRR